ncbi:MAG: hypothetical protein AB7G11_09960 [Phycisphaerales bacterium]
MKTVAVAAVLTLAGAASADIYHDDGYSQGVFPAQGPISIESFAGARGGQVVYDASTQTGFRYNAGQAGTTTPADNLRTPYDDVPIPNAILNGATSLDVCRVTVGIRRLTGAPATDVSVYWSTLTTMVMAPDTEIDLPSNLIGTVSLPAAAATATELVSLGTSGGPTLFNVPLNSTLISGFGTFAIGMNLSSTDPLNGWRITNGPSANANVFWQHDPNHTGQANDEAAFLFSSANPPNPPATFFIIVEGTPVPAPGAAALLGLGGLLAARRRR